MTFLLDTNVISELRKPRPDRNVQRWFASVPGSELYLSVLVIGEIRQGIELLRRRDAARAEGYSTWLAALQTEFRDRLVPVTAAVAEAWGRLNVPDPIPAIDGLMAATAHVHKLTFVTRNTSDVASSGIALLNPFEE